MTVLTVSCIVLYLDNLYLDVSKLFPSFFVLLRVVSSELWVWPTGREMAYHCFYCCQTGIKSIRLVHCLELGREDLHNLCF